MAKQEACFARATVGCGLLSNTTSVSLLTNESPVDVQSVLHAQMSLAAVNQIRVIQYLRIESYFSAFH